MRLIVGKNPYAGSYTSGFMEKNKPKLSKGNANCKYN